MSACESIPNVVQDCFMEEVTQVSPERVRWQSGNKGIRIDMDESIGRSSRLVTTTRPLCVSRERLFGKRERNAR